MNQVVLKLSMEKIRNMENYYKKYLKEKVPAGAVFTAKTPNCTITAYHSGKVLFQGADSKAESSIWGEEKIKKQNTSNKMTHLPENFSGLSVIGSDEVGTGDYFGPITVVASFVKKDQISLLTELGVKDSKDLTDKKIIEIAKQIKDIIPFSLLILPNEKYNDLQQKGMSQGKMKALLHNQAIGHVLKKIAPLAPDAILIDEFAKKEIYYNYLRGEKEIHRENVYFHTKAESIHVAVAASSILARYAFIQQFELLSKDAGFTLPKGAGSQVDKAAARLIQEKGGNALRHFAKLHFANTEKALKLVHHNK